MQPSLISLLLALKNDDAYSVNLQLPRTHRRPHRRPHSSYRRTLLRLTRRRQSRRLSDPLLERLPTHRTLALALVGEEPVAYTVHVEAVGAASDD